VRHSSSSRSLDARPRLLILVAGQGVFEHRDAELLSEDFQIEFLPVKNLRPNGLMALFFDLFRARRRIDRVYVFFADLHFATAALFCRIFRKRLVVCVAGYDANYVDAISYGMHPHGRRGKLISRALYWADTIAPVHESLIDFRTDYAYPRHTGLLVRSPDLDPKRFQVLPFGYDSDFWQPLAGTPRNSRRVVCLGSPWGADSEADYPAAEQKIRVKGLDLVIKAAPLLPELEFFMLGVTSDKMLLRSAGMEALPPNVRIEGRLSDTELRERFSTAHVFLMPSLTEGHPNAVCEAMLCGCVPVGSPVNAIPDIIGEAGILLREHTPENLAQSILRALEMEGTAARARIRDRYPLKRRKEGLTRILTTSSRTPSQDFTHFPRTRP
jgi:glycosyltransferase involved in cell wall biosynthesis